MQRKKYYPAIYFFRLTIAVVLICLCTPSRAHAYLDPGSGSYFFQLLIAGFFGALFAIKTFWNKITGFLKRLFSRKKHEQ